MAVLMYSMKPYVIVFFVILGGIVYYQNRQMNERVDILFQQMNQIHRDNWFVRDRVLGLYKLIIKTSGVQNRAAHIAFEVDGQHGVLPIGEYRHGYNPGIPQESDVRYDLTLYYNEEKQSWMVKWVATTSDGSGGGHDQRIQKPDLLTDKEFLYLLTVTYDGHIYSDGHSQIGAFYADQEPRREVKYRYEVIEIE